MSRLLSILFFSLMALIALVGCSSAPVQKQAVPQPATLTAADSAVIQAAIEKQQKPKYEQNLDVSHESFIRAMELELRGEKALAEVFWQRAYDADPGNRYLAFSVAERLAAHGEDSAALVLAQKAGELPGRGTSSQFSLLANLYVKAGIADSARRYFVMALDTCHYQDMSILYDYSLFLEAVKDANELVRVYDLLLPQVNYIQSLFQRQLALLLDLGRDSAVVELFGKGHEATGDKKLLLQMVQGLTMQKRFAEAKSIADTLTSVTPEDEKIINLVLLTLSEKDKQEPIKFLRKKMNDDGVTSPVLEYFLANYEYAAGDIDSAKVHFEKVYPKLEDNMSYSAQSCRALAGIAFSQDKNDLGVQYAERADSILHGADKEFLAMSYGYAKMYDKAYHILDSLLGVWANWTPMSGVADSASLKLIKQKAERNYRNVQSSYAKILVTEAREIESDKKSDSAKMAYAKECRGKAELFWENLYAADSSDLLLRLTMAMNLERLARYDESFAIFEELLKIEKPEGIDRPEMLNYYGYSLIDLNRNAEDVEKGFRLVMEALGLEKSPIPTEAYLDSKAWGLYRQGKFAEALAVMQEIKGDQFKEDYVYWEHLAAIQAALGMNDEATKSYKEVLKLRPDHPAALEFLKKK